MLSGIPNFLYTIGYTNASWTLKADLVSAYVVRLLKHMDANGLRKVVAVKDPSVGEQPFMDFSSGYVLRALDSLPKQGDRAPWLLKQNYITDLRTISKRRHRRRGARVRVRGATGMIGHRSGNRTTSHPPNLWRSPWGSMTRSATRPKT